MGYATPQIGYEGYVASNDILQEDTTTYNSFGGGGTTTKITGKAITDVSEESVFRFKVSLMHSQVGHNIEMRLKIGSTEIWYKIWTATDLNWHTFTKDIAVVWRRGDNISVKNQASANTGSMKDFQICGIVSPMRLD